MNYSLKLAGPEAACPFLGAGRRLAVISREMPERACAMDGAAGRRLVVISREVPEGACAMDGAARKRLVVIFR